MRISFFLLLIYFPSFFVQAQENFSNKIFYNQFQYHNLATSDALASNTYVPISNSSYKRNIKDSIAAFDRVNTESNSIVDLPKNVAMQQAEGFIIDSSTNTPIPHAQITLLAAFDIPIANYTTDANGFFKIQIPVKSSFFLKLTEKNYNIRYKKIFYHQQVSTADYFKVYLNPTLEKQEVSSSYPFIEPKDIPYLYVNGNYLLNMPNFDFNLNESGVSEDYFRAINKLITILKANKDLVIEIAVHADARGPEAYIETLTLKRAEEIQNLLISKGDIASERIIAKGYGYSKVINGCTKYQKCTEKQHLINRRVEFVILNPMGL